MQIKVCGITNNRNLRDISLMRPDYMGFIFHGSSPRDVTGTVGLLDLDTIPPCTRKTAVFVDQPFKKVTDTITRYRFDAVQLHGKEDPSFCSDLMNECLVIKAFGIKESLPENLEKYMGNCHWFLFDAKGKYPGGNGIKFNHDVLKSYALDVPFFLSGGIGDQDLPLLAEMAGEGLQGVDVNSRFELSPGYKCASSLKKFIQKIRTYEL